MLKGSKEWRAEDVECRGSISARVSSDEGKEKKKRNQGKKGRERDRARVQRKRECELLTISSESTSSRED